MTCHGTCPACLAGFESNCTHGGSFGDGDGDGDGGQGEQVRAPFADATLMDERRAIKSLLTISEP
jgi:alcohol dehydrogenase